ncbi:MAG: phage tail protein [Sporomusaceae bacterium]|nr:phage tail protein [Sporomusaceae bacterium]
MIEFDEKQFERARLLLHNVPNGIERAAAAALNRAAEHAKTASMRKVRETYTIKTAKIDARLQVQRASTASLFASVRDVGRPIVLSYFNIRPNQPPGKRIGKLVYAQVRRDAGGTIKKVFVARMKSGHVGVWWRANGNKSLPIKQLHAPSLPQMLGSPSVSEFTTKAAVQVLQVRLEHEISRLLKG